MILLDAHNAKRLLAGEKRVSLDLGLTETDAPEIRKDFLERVAKDENCAYFIQDDHLFKAMLSDDKPYKLVPVPGHAPMLTIGGIRMHLTKNTSPEQNAADIAEAAHIKKGDIVLDSCMGLGYTAIAAVRRGAKVITIELDDSVFELARINPWSQGLFSKNVEIKRGDTAVIINGFADAQFDAIIHDPPRVALAGQLYSAEFYKELYRVAKRGAQLVHYTGNPGTQFRNKSTVPGVMRRLQEAGWRLLERSEKLQGIVAIKP